MDKRWLSWIAALGLVLAVPSTPALARQAEPPLVLVVHRDFGFAAGGRIQGAFSLTVTGRDDLVEVRYLLDGEVIGIVREPPFRLRFSTGDYALGPHVLAAIAITAQGEEIRTQERTLEFVGADEGLRTAMRIGLPLLGLLVVAILVGVLVPLALGRRGEVFRAGYYGVAGGAVCPRCGLPFSRHGLSPNLVVGKLERCPHCGKWSVVPRASTEALRQAEARLAKESRRGALEVESGEERLRRRLDESRYEE